MLEGGARQEGERGFGTSVRLRRNEDECECSKNQRQGIPTASLCPFACESLVLCPGERDERRATTLDPRIICSRCMSISRSGIQRETIIVTLSSEVDYAKRCEASAREARVHQPTTSVHSLPFPALECTQMQRRASFPLCPRCESRCDSHSQKSVFTVAVAVQLHPGSV